MRVLRVPADGVPRVSSLPVGIPSPGMTAAIAHVAPDVVHLAQVDLRHGVGTPARRSVRQRIWPWSATSCSGTTGRCSARACAAAPREGSDTPRRRC